MARLRLAVLVSGRGSNLESLLAASRAGRMDADVALVVSSRSEAPALQVAAAHRVPTRVVPAAGLSREEHDALVGDAVESATPDLVLLAGYMRILGDNFVASHRGRLLNIHPALLPAFPGLDAPRQAHERGARIVGCTVHFVTEDVDAGPILGQAALVADPAWSADELAARILALEHRLYPACVQLLASGRARLVGDRVVFKGVPAGEGALVSAEVDG